MGNYQILILGCESQFLGFTYIPANADVINVLKSIPTLIINEAITYIKNRTLFIVFVV